MLLVLFCANSLFTYLTYFELTRSHSLSPFRAALVTLPAVTPAVFTGRWAAARARDPGDGPPLMRTGLLCLAAGLLPSGPGHGGPVWLTAVSCALVGCGLGLANGAAMATVTRARPQHAASRATATATTFAMLGGVAGPALSPLPLHATALAVAVASVFLTTRRPARPACGPS
ncbi:MULTISPECIES: MFS transporter [Streptomyces]|uniref:MFS transporter n=1 Tax=Streptomyces luteosporeus TaxID=173856 RepID=A0ABN3TIX1_9ACTN